MLNVDQKFFFQRSQIFTRIFRKLFTMDWFDQIMFTASSASLVDDEEYLLFCLAAVGKQESKRRGSRPGRRPNVDRDFRFGHEKLFQDYFSDTPTYDEKHFLRRFRIPKEMFLDIMRQLESSDDFFQLRCDAAGKVGLSPLQKCTAALRMLAYGSSASSLDENLRIGESTSLLTLRNFCKAILKNYGPQYLRPPTPEEVTKLMNENATRGFPGMVGSLDCMHWVWKNCPVALKGQYQGKEGKPTIVLEAFASQDTYIWHGFFGCPGSCNDINILDRSPLLSDVLQDNILGGTWRVQDKTFNQGYLLADGIYPDWPLFLKTITNPQTSKEKHFAKCQESARKDVERCFGILQSCWQILVHPCRIWDEETIRNIMLTCIILHNMRIKYKTADTMVDFYEAESVGNPNGDEFDAEFIPVGGLPRSFDQICQERSNLRDSSKYYEQRNFIMEHLWAVKGESM